MAPTYAVAVRTPQGPAATVLQTVQGVRRAFSEVCSSWGLVIDPVATLYLRARTRPAGGDVERTVHLRLSLDSVAGIAAELEFDEPVRARPVSLALGMGLASDEAQHAASSIHSSRSSVWYGSRVAELDSPDANFPAILLSEFEHLLASRDLAAAPGDEAQRKVSEGDQSEWVVLSRQLDSVGDTQMAQVFENERWLVFYGYSPRNLGAYSAIGGSPDPAQFSDASGRTYASLEEATTMIADGQRWAWDEAEWHLDTSPQGGGVDDQGWQHAPRFSGPWGATSDMSTYVRRRRWIRSMRQITDATRIFGVPLEKLLARELRSHFIPVFVEQALDYLYEHGLGEEGILRECGSSRQVAHRMHQLDAGLPPVFQHGDDVNMVASLLKQFLRDLPDRLFPPTHYAVLADAAAAESPDAALDAIRRVVEGVSPAAQNLLLAMFAFFHSVAKRSAENKMQPRNIAACLAPSLFAVGIASDSLDHGAMPISAAQRVVEVMIEGFYRVFF